MIINSQGLDPREINELIRTAKEESIILNNCLGQRFIGSGLGKKEISINGIPGNALGAYLNGASITVNGNAQDAVGDTMESGEIVIHGSAGDAAGYSMRGGEIYIKNNAGYRAGVHMKEYKQKKPVIVIGGRAGSFLGEYQAGGIIIVLGLNSDGRPIVSNFPCTGMHGGKMILRGELPQIHFPHQTTSHTAGEDDFAQFAPFIKKYCDHFGADYDKLINDKYTVITPDSKNPYKQMYVSN